MTTKQIINWIRGKLAYAPDHAWKNMMQETATMLARLESNLKTAVAQRNEYQEKYLAEREQNAQLEDELAGERYRHDRYVDYTLGLEDKLEQLKDRHRWIPVTERLPEPGVRVLATDGGFVGEFYINKRGQWQRYNVNDSSLLMALDILWWMPMVEPPKEEV